jgi:hypothetical protein
MFIFIPNIKTKTMEQTLNIKTKKLQFGIGNEVSGWFKTTDGEKTSFKIYNDGEVEHSGNESELHPFILGLYEMLFSVE